MGSDASPGPSPRIRRLSRPPADLQLLPLFGEWRLTLTVLPLRISYTFGVYASDRNPGSTQSTSKQRGSRARWSTTPLHNTQKETARFTNIRIHLDFVVVYGPGHKCKNYRVAIPVPTREPSLSPNLFML
jgi:hypothetical protein